MFALEANFYPDRFYQVSMRLEGFRQLHPGAIFLKAHLNLICSFVVTTGIKFKQSGQNWRCF
jgi:hypothetical protein